MTTNYRFNLLAKISAKIPPQNYWGRGKVGRSTAANDVGFLLGFELTVGSETGEEESTLLFDLMVDADQVAISAAVLTVSEVLMGVFLTMVGWAD